MKTSIYRRNQIKQEGDKGSGSDQDNRHSAADPGSIGIAAVTALNGKRSRCKRFRELDVGDRKRSGQLTVLSVAPVRFNNATCYFIADAPYVSVSF